MVSRGSGQRRQRQRCATRRPSGAAVEMSAGDLLRAHPPRSTRLQDDLRCTARPARTFSLCCSICCAPRVDRSGASKADPLSMPADRGPWTVQSVGRWIDGSGVERSGAERTASTTTPPPPAALARPRLATCRTLSRRRPTRRVLACVMSLMCEADGLVSVPVPAPH